MFHTNRLVDIVDLIICHRTGPYHQVEGLQGRSPRIHQNPTEAHSLIVMILSNIHYLSSIIINPSAHGVSSV